MSLFNWNNSNSPNNDDNNGTDDVYEYARRTRTSSIIVFVVILIAVLLYSMFGHNFACSGETTSGRVKLDQSQCYIVSNWYDRETEYTQTKTLEGMATFYEATGIQPIVLVVEEDRELTLEELNARAEEYYKNELFDGIADEGHTVFAFQPSNGIVGIYSGSDAVKVMDADAVTKFRDILSQSYNKYKGVEILNKTFNNAAGKIMGRSMSNIYFIIILAVAFVGYTVYGLIRTSKRAKANR